MKMKHTDKFAYFFIAFAIYLLVRSVSMCFALASLTSLLYIFIALSLLASNIPRVLDIPMHYVYPLRCVEYFSFTASVICFIILCVKYFIIR